MSEPIKVGDLVVIVRGHTCVLNKIGGVPFVVLSMVPQTGGGWHCHICNTYDHYKYDLWGARGPWHTDSRSGIPLSWLKKIDPQALHETVEHDEEIPA